MVCNAKLFEQKNRKIFMKTKNSLRKIEKQAYRSTFEDGIYDIIIGMLFLILALIPALEYFEIPGSYAYILGLIPLLTLWLGKRNITIPRLGLVKFGEKRKSKRKLLLIISAVVLFLMLPVLMITLAKGFPIKLQGNPAISPIVLMTIAPFLVIAAYFLDYLRMFIYVLVLFGVVLNADFMLRYVGDPLNSVISFGFAGVVILFYGISLLAKFLKKYPKPNTEVPYAGQE